MAALTEDRSEQVRRESEAELQVRNQARAIDVLLGTIENLKTKLAMRDQQLREADAMVARLKVDMDDLRLVAVRADMQRMALSERLGSTELDTAPELWEAIVTAAIRWRRGADRGELAAAVDAFRGQPGAIVSDLKGLAARESDPVCHPLEEDPVWQAAMRAPVVEMTDRERTSLESFLQWQKEKELRPEQYADGAGAQAWRQAMGGKL